MFGPRDFASWEFKTNQTRTKTMPVTATVSTFHFRCCKMMPFDNRAEASFRLGLQGEHTGFLWWQGWRSKPTGQNGVRYLCRSLTSSLNARWDESHHLERGRTTGVGYCIGYILSVVHGAVNGALRVALSILRVDNSRYPCISTFCFWLWTALTARLVDMELWTVDMDGPASWQLTKNRSRPGSIWQVYKLLQDYAWSCNRKQTVRR